MYKKIEILQVLEELVLQIKQDIAEEDMGKHFYTAFKDAEEVVQEEMYIRKDIKGL